jgi:hypothetical protein
LLLGGLGLAVYALGTWGAEGFGALAYAETMWLVIPSSTAILLGFQIIHGAFFVSILEIRAARPGEETVPDRSAKGRPHQASVRSGSSPCQERVGQPRSHRTPAPLP